MAAIWCAQIILFAYLVSYLIYRFVPHLTAGQAARLHHALLPAQLGSQVLDSMPVYGGPVMLIIGALLAGGDHRWGTLRTLLARRPGRAEFLAGRAATMAAVMLAISVLSLVISGVCSTVIAVISHFPAGWPSAGSLLLHLAALWLICLAWAMTGFALAVLTRSLTAAIGIGLMWTLVVENIVAGLSASVPALAELRKGLLSAATGSLAQALSGSAVPSGVPGVASVVSGPVAALVLVLYVAAGFGAAVLVFRRRDVT
jgi:ABC-type transport system involved in multi-copper enzyme maturation permease subunit